MVVAPGACHGQAKPYGAGGLGLVEYILHPIFFSDPPPFPIDHMVSVHASFVAVKFEYITNKYKEPNSEAIKDVDLHNIINREEYYDNIIKQKIPDKVREINFTHFISYDFKNIPVNYKLIHKDNFVTILNGQNKVVKVVNIV